MVWSATDDVGDIASYTLLVSTDGGNRFRTLLRGSDRTEFTYAARSGESPTFLVRAIDAAGNVEPAPVAARVPKLLPSINLGDTPLATNRFAPPTPNATADSDAAVADRFFEENMLGIPSRTSAARPSGYTRVIRPLAAERLTSVAGISGANIGILAVAADSSGQVFFSGGPGRDELYVLRGEESGGSGSAADRLDAYPPGLPIYDMAFDAAGQLWATTGGQSLLQIDPASGRILRRIGGGISLGIAAVPGQNVMMVATTGGIVELDTVTGDLTPFSDVRVDSIAVAADGTVYGTGWPGNSAGSNDDVLRFDFRGRATRVASIDGGAESIAIGGGRNTARRRNHRWSPG